MNIQQIYDRFGIPKNLREHMLRVTAVARLIADGWMGGGLDKEMLLRAGLVHDVANIVIFELDANSELAEKQKEIILKYGNDDHIATKKMLRELGMSREIINIVQMKSFGNAIEVEVSDNWPLKILLYSDMRVVPSGVVDLETRLHDMVTRKVRYRDHPRKEELMQKVRSIEKQIQSMTRTSLHEINEKEVSGGMEDLLEKEI